MPNNAPDLQTAISYIGIAIYELERLYGVDDAARYTMPLFTVRSELRDRQAQKPIATEQVAS